MGNATQSTQVSVRKFDEKIKIFEFPDFSCCSRIPKAVEENQYPNLETLDVEEEKPEPNPTSPFQDVLSSNSWLTSFHKKNFDDIFKMFVGMPRWNPWWQK